MHLCENAEPQTYTGAIRMLPRFDNADMLEIFPNGVTVDVCLALEVFRLWEKGIKTTGCCCGHGRQPGYIGVTDEHIPAMKALGYQVIDRPECPERRDSFVPKTKLT